MAVDSMCTNYSTAFTTFSSSLGRMVYWSGTYKAYILRIINHSSLLSIWYIRKVIRNTLTMRHKRLYLWRIDNNITIESWVSSHERLNITCNFGPHGRLPGIWFPYPCIVVATLTPWNEVHGRLPKSGCLLAWDATVCHNKCDHENDKIGCCCCCSISWILC